MEGGSTRKQPLSEESDEEEGEITEDAGDLETSRLPNSPSFSLEIISDADEEFEASSDESVILLPTIEKASPEIITLSDSEDERELLNLRRTVLEGMLTKVNASESLGTDNYDEALMEFSPVEPLQPSEHEEKDDVEDQGEKERECYLREEEEVDSEKEEVVELDKEEEEEEDEELRRIWIEELRKRDLWFLDKESHPQARDQLLYKPINPQEGGQLPFFLPNSILPSFDGVNIQVSKNQNPYFPHDPINPVHGLTMRSNEHCLENSNHGIHPGAPLFNTNASLINARQLRPHHVHLHRNDRGSHIPSLVTNRDHVGELRRVEDFDARIHPIVPLPPMFSLENHSQGSFTNANLGLTVDHPTPATSMHGFPYALGRDTDMRRLGSIPNPLATLTPVEPMIGRLNVTVPSSPVPTVPSSLFGSPFQVNPAFETVATATPPMTNGAETTPLEQEYLSQSLTNGKGMPKVPDRCPPPPCIRISDEAYKNASRRSNGSETLSSKSKGSRGTKRKHGRSVGVSEEKHSREKYRKVERRNRKSPRRSFSRRTLTSSSRRSPVRTRKVSTSAAAPKARASTSTNGSRAVRSTSTNGSRAVRSTSTNGSRAVTSTSTNGSRAVTSTSSRAPSAPPLNPTPPSGVSKAQQPSKDLQCQVTFVPTGLRLVSSKSKIHPEGLSITVVNENAISQASNDDDEEQLRAQLLIEVSKTRLRRSPVGTDVRTVKMSPTPTVPASSQPNKSRKMKKHQFVANGQVKNSRRGANTSKIKPIIFNVGTNDSSGSEEDDSGKPCKPSGSTKLRVREVNLEKPSDLNSNGQECSIPDSMSNSILKFISNARTVAAQHLQEQLQQKEALSSSIIHPAMSHMPPGHQAEYIKLKARLMEHETAATADVGKKSERKSLPRTGSLGSPRQRLRSSPIKKPIMLTDKSTSLPPHSSNIPNSENTAQEKVLLPQGVGNSTDKNFVISEGVPSVAADVMCNGEEGIPSVVTDVICNGDDFVRTIEEGIFDTPVSKSQYDSCNTDEDKEDALLIDRCGEDSARFLEWRLKESRPFDGMVIMSPPLSENGKYDALKGAGEIRVTAALDSAGGEDSSGEDDETSGESPGNDASDSPTQPTSVEVPDTDGDDTPSSVESCETPERQLETCGDSEGDGRGSSCLENTRTGDDFLSSSGDPLSMKSILEDSSLPASTELKSFDEIALVGGFCDLFPQEEPAARESQRRELILRERLLKATLVRKMEQSEWQRRLKNAETLLLEKRVDSLGKFEALHTKLHNLSAEKTLQLDIEQELERIRNEVRTLERQLSQVETNVKSLEADVKERTVGAVESQTECLKTTETCIEYGGKLHGINYLLPNTNKAEYERKLSEIQKRMDELKVATLPSLPKLNTLPPSLPSPTKVTRRRVYGITMSLEEESESESDTDSELEEGKIIVHRHRFIDAVTENFDRIDKRFIPYHGILSTVRFEGETSAGEMGIEFDPIKEICTRELESGCCLVLACTSQHLSTRAGCDV